MKINGIEIDGKITVEHNGKTFVFDDVEDFATSIRMGGTSENKAKYLHLSEQPEYHLMFEYLSDKQLDKIESVLEGLFGSKNLIVGDPQCIMETYPDARPLQINEYYYSLYIRDSYEPIGCEAIVVEWLCGDMDSFTFICEMEEF